MRLNCPCVSDTVSLAHRHPVRLTARRQNKDTSGEPRVFSLPALATTRASLFIPRSNRFLFHAHSKYPACLARGGKVFAVGRADVHVFRVIALFWRPLRELKEAADRSLETQTECEWALSASRRQRALMYIARSARARLCTLAKAPLESKCLMG